MDSIVGKVMRPFAAVWRVIALTLVICATGGVWADPVAEWGPGDFPESSSGDYSGGNSTKSNLTLKKNNGKNSATTDYLLIGTNAGNDGWPAFVDGMSYDAISVVVAYSLGSDKQGAVLGLDNTNGTGKFFVNVASDRAMYLGYNCPNTKNESDDGTATSGSNSSQWASLSTTHPDDSDIHYLVLTYSRSGDGEATGTGVYFDGTRLGNWPGLREGSYAINNVCLGALKKPKYILNQAKFYYVAVYDSKLGDSDALAAYARAFENINGATRKIDITADSAFDSLTGFADLAGNAASWTAGNNLFVTVPAAAADTVTLTLPTGGLDAGSLLKLDVAEGKTLALSGSLSATSVVVTGAGAVDFSAATVTGTVKGDGTVVYSGVVPTRGLGWTDSSAWTGTVWVKNKSGVTGNNNASTGIQFNTIGNSNSKVKVSGITGWLEAPVTVTPEVVLDDDTYGFAWKVSDGNSPQNNDTNKNRATTFTKLSGSGTLMTNNGDGKNAWPVVVVNDGSEFAGSINTGTSGTCLEVAFLAANETFAETSYYAYFNTSRLRTIYISSGSSVSIASGKTWSATNGIIVKGSLTLVDSNSTVSGNIMGNGTVVCDGFVVANAGLADSANWTGTVEINGDAGQAQNYYNSDNFCNDNSKLRIHSGYVYMSTLSELPCEVSVDSGATLYIGNQNLDDLALKIGTLDGTIDMRPSSYLETLNLNCGALRILNGRLAFPESLSTLNLTVSESLSEDGVITMTLPTASEVETATASVINQDGTIVAAEATISDTTVTIQFAPTVSGRACWCDYEMDYVSGNASKTGFENTGSDTTGLNSDSGITGDNAFYNGMLYTYAHPWRNISYPSDGNWTAVVRCTVPAYENAAVITFGTQGGGLIGLVAGEHPETEMRLVQTTGNSHFITNATMTVQNGTTAQHVYVFTVETNQTVKVYCDGAMVLDKTFESRFTIGGGIQIGSVHGGVGDTGIIRFAKGETPANTLSETDQKNARIDCVRLYKTVLGPNAIRQLSVEFPAVKLYRATVADGANTDWNSLSWSPAWDGGNAYSKIILTAAGDASLTFPSSITAEDFEVNVEDGCVLTLAKAAGGTTLTLTNPIEVNTGSIAFEETEMEMDFTVGGTGSIFVGSGKTISVVSGGSIPKLAGSGTVTYASYGSLPGALTFGNWTGTVVLPSFEANGVNFSNYGKSGSTVALTGITGGWLGETSAGNASVAPALRLDGNVTITGFSTSWAYTFAEITGTGNLSFAPADNHPGSLAITKVAAGFSGVISNTTDKNLVIGTLDRAAETTVTVGSKVLSTSSNVSASALTLAGVATGIIPVFDTDGLYVKAASVTKNNTTTNYNLLSDAVTALGNDAGILTLLMSTDSNFTLEPGQTLKNANLTSGNISASANWVEVVIDGGTYTAVDNRASTWTNGGAGNAWNTAANWSTGCIPSQYTTVTFPAESAPWTVTIPNDSGDAKCGAMVLNGNTTVAYTGGSWAALWIYGGVTGEGTLTLDECGLRNKAESAVTIATPVVTTASDNCFLAGSAYTFSGTVTVSAGQLKAEYSTVTFSGLVTINDSANVKANGDGSSVAFNGGISVPADAAAALQIYGGAITVGSTVTLASGATLTVPNSADVAGATFVPPSNYYRVDDKVVDSTTVYSVEKKPGTIFSVY